MRRVFMMRSVHNILKTCLNIQPKENLLILTDTNKLEIAEIFFLVGQEMGAEVVLGVMTPRTRHGEEPPRIIAEAMKAADAIVAPTTFSVNHSQARMAASDAGARLIFMPDACDELFMDGSLEIDYMERKAIIEQVSRVLENGKIAEISSALGTQLRLNISGRHAVAQSGICHTPGSISPPPCIETAIAPLENGTNGIIYIDGAVVPGGVCYQAIKITFEQGKIVSIEGENEAQALSKLLESYNDPNMYYAVELGFGMNPVAKIGQAGSLEDEAEFGTIHIGIGNGITFGSSIRAPGHCDLVMRDAIVKIDGKLLMQNCQLHLENFS